MLERKGSVRLHMAFMMLVLMFAWSDVSFARWEGCDEIEVCNPSADCERECNWDFFVLTCGTFEGGAADGYCDGGCGDDICSGWTESCSSCADDCDVCPTEPTCGQDGCEVGENCGNCAQDCGACPDVEIPDDGHCDDDEDPEESDDCLQNGYCADNSDCTFPQGQYGYRCVENVCVPNSLPAFSPACVSSLDCDWWKPGQGWICRIPEGELTGWCVTRLPT